MSKVSKMSILRPTLIERSPYFELSSQPELTSSLNVDSFSQTQRKNWSEQIYNDLKRLYSIDVCWDDAKAENIILDKKSNLWLIDFEEDYTNEWVDAHLTNSEKDNLQELQRIIKFLHVFKEWNIKI